MAQATSESTRGTRHIQKDSPPALFGGGRPSPQVGTAQPGQSPSLCPKEIQDNLHHSPPSPTMSGTCTSKTHCLVRGLVRRVRCDVQVLPPPGTHHTSMPGAESLSSCNRHCELRAPRRRRPNQNSTLRMRTSCLVRFPVNHRICGNLTCQGRVRVAGPSHQVGGSEVWVSGWGLPASSPSPRLLLKEGGLTPMPPPILYYISGRSLSLPPWSRRRCLPGWKAPMAMPHGSAPYSVVVSAPIWHQAFLLRDQPQTPAV